MKGKVGGRGGAELTDSNDILAQLGGGLHQHRGEDLHAWSGKAVDEVGALGRVTLSSTEALTSEDSDTLGDGLWILHEVGDAGHDVSPVAEDALHLAQAELPARVTASDESGVEAVGHVSPPHGKTRLASSGISSLGANLGDQDSSLLLN